MDDLLDEDTDLVWFCLVPESDDSSNNVSNESSGAMRTRNQTKF